MMDYKGYIGDVKYDSEAHIFHGEVINTRDVITFQGKSVDEIEQAFQQFGIDFMKCNILIEVLNFIINFVYWFIHIDMPCNRMTYLTKTIVTKTKR